MDMSGMGTGVAEIGVAFAGGGMVSDLHRAALASTPGLRLVGVHDADPGVAARRAAEWGVRAYAGLEEMLEDDAVHAVYVLTPAESHVPIARRCLERGRHVLVEKPVSRDPAEVDALIATARASGRVAMAAHNYAYIPEFRRISRLARDGSLGALRAIWVTYALKHPEAVAAAYGGVLEEVMIHHSYLTLAIAGPPERLHAGVHPGAWERHPAEDQAWMAWEYADGSSAFLFATFAADDNSADPWTFAVKVIGTEGSASMSWRSAVARNTRTSWFAFGLPVYEESYGHEAQALRDAIRSDAPLASTLEDAATSARLVAAAYEAARERRVVARGEDGRARW